MSTTTYLTFGQAIEALKAGNSVAREAWDKKGTHLFMTRGVIDRKYLVDPATGLDLAADSLGEVSGVALTLFDKGDTGIHTRMPHISMFSDFSNLGEIYSGWVAYAADMLAEDWYVLPTV